METGDSERDRAPERDLTVGMSFGVANELLAWGKRLGLGGDLDVLLDEALRRYLGGVGTERDDLPNVAAQVRARQAHRDDGDAEVDSGRGGFAMLSSDSFVDQELLPLHALAGLAPAPLAAWRDEAADDRAKARFRLATDRRAAKAFTAAASRALGYRASSDSDAAIFVPPETPFGGWPSVAPSTVPLGVGRDEHLDRGHALPVGDGGRVIEPLDLSALGGLTNRLAPTFWGASMLVLMAGAGGAVRVSDYLAQTLPVAWRIGAGLRAWEDGERDRARGGFEGRRRGLPLRWSARWPTPSGDPSREASSAMTFTRASLGTWNERGKQGRAVDGPLFLFGLAEIVAPDDPDDHWCIRPTPRARSLAQALSDAGATCDYPYDDAVWAILRDCLADTPTGELRRAWLALEAVRDTNTTDDFREQVALRLGDGAATGVAGEASAHLARLKELGLVGVDGPSLGPDAITDRGYVLLRELT